MKLRSIFRTRFPEAASSGAILAVLMATHVAAASSALPPALTTAQLLDFCRSTTVGEAKRKGDVLGWRTMGKADGASEWRERFLDMNGGTLWAVTWRRGEEDGDGILSFWVANGESQHQACSYSARTSARILDDLKRAFGKPSHISTYKDVEIVVWTHGSREVSFSRVNLSIGVTIVYKH